jgi:sigma-B regulation protein RsbU (phosphoserine phosphatase)
LAKLVITTLDGRTHSVDLSTRPIKLGRAESCDVVLRNDAEVSREHAQVRLDAGGRVVVEDLGSKNGTRVDDGEPFKSTARVAYRTVRIGEHAMQLLGATATGEGLVHFEDTPTPLADTQFFPSTRGLDLNQHRLDHLMQLTERIGGVFERKQLLEQALDACCDTLGFERGLIALKTQRGDTELPVTRNVQRDETGAFRISRTLINRALVEGERAIVNNPATDLAGNMTESLVRFPICSALCVPILHRNEILGVIYGDRVTQASAYQPEDVDFLAAIARQVGVGLVNLRMFQDQVQTQRLRSELQQARTIQRRLLPASTMTIGRVRLEGYNQPSSAVSGDYYDYFEIDSQRVGIIVADVTGHGLPAALIMANLQSAVRVALSADVSLTDLARRVNQLICRNTDSHVFVTGVLGVLDVRSGAVEYVSAGHPAPILLARGRAWHVPVEHNSLPLGVEPDEPFEVQRIEPANGTQAVLFYTDGMTEAADPSGALLGLDVFLDEFSRLSDLSSAGIIESARGTLRRELGDEPLNDDLTLLAIEMGA